MKNNLLILLAVILNLSCTGQSTELRAGILFYNVENLYDTINDPQKDDEEFLPASDRKWNSERYDKKLFNLAKVITSAGNELPDFIGLCEIENEQVISDLVAQENLAPGNYKWVHYDSPDERGIDVAFLYDSKKFKPTKSNPIYIDLGGDSVDYTRDILMVEGEYQFGDKSWLLYFFINHWPSRAEGEEISAPKRIAAATILKHVTDSIFAIQPGRSIIIMGDFNDTPFDKSINLVLGAKQVSNEMEKTSLYNLVADKQSIGEGSYNFKGKWQALDQIIVSGSLVDNIGLDFDLGSTKYIRESWMLYHNDKYGDSPDRTFAGTKYIGGYSDHLPAYGELILR
ncbi:MAG: hypothetical protein ACHQFW_01575 [Chitinophagales bacterium]